MINIKTIINNLVPIGSKVISNIYHHTTQTKKIPCNNALLQAGPSQVAQHAGTMAVAVASVGLGCSEPAAKCDNVS